METLYWSLEFLKVAISYVCILFIWPRVVFRKHLANKDKTYGFAFCVTVQPVLINTVVIGLGLLHILNPVVLWVLFYGVFLFSVFRKATIQKIFITRMKNFFAGTYGPKSMVTDVFGFIGGRFKILWKMFLAFMDGSWFRYCTLGVVLLFGAIYFIYGSFQNQSYAFSDYYVHHMWIYNLVNGKVFSSGIYPEGMHCFIGLQNMLFGNTIQSCFIFLGGIHSVAMLVSIYLFCRELFSWKYTPILAVALFLFIDVKGLEVINSFSRLACTLPQEWAFPALFLCVTYLVKYLRKKNVSGTKKIRELLKDENLLMFTSALTTTIIVHFYATILAFFLCVAVVIPLLKKLFTRKFLPLVISCVFSLIISCVPMAAAYASGIPLQGSLTWALSIMGSDDEEEAADQVNSEEAVKETADTVSFYENTNQVKESGVTASIGKATNSVIYEMFLDSDIVSDNKSSKISVFYNDGLVAIFEESRAKFIVVYVIGVVLLWIAIRVAMSFRKNEVRWDKKESDAYDGYIMIVLALMIYVLCWASHSLGLPSVIETYRLGAMAQFSFIALIAIPFDAFGSKFIENMSEKASYITISAFVIGAYIVIRAMGAFHGYLIIALTRYNSAINVTESIVSSMKKDTYTIVSTTDEYYQQIDKGFHEELISFVNKAEVVSYSIPTEYIFIYIEKNAMYRPQYHAFDGPSWLADGEKAPKYLGSLGSSGDDVYSMAISEDMSEVYFGPFNYSVSVYNTLWKRVALMSKAYYWCQKFNDMYPNELHTYYEDDDFVCYYLKQNPRNLYELAVMDSASMILPNEYPNPIWPVGEYR